MHIALLWLDMIVSYHSQTRRAGLLWSLSNMSLVCFLTMSLSLGNAFAGSKARVNKKGPGQSVGKIKGRDGRSTFPQNNNIHARRNGAFKRSQSKGLARQKGNVFLAACTALLPMLIFIVYMGDVQKDRRDNDRRVHLEQQRTHIEQQRTAFREKRTRLTSDLNALKTEISELEAKGSSPVELNELKERLMTLRLDILLYELSGHPGADRGGTLTAKYMLTQFRLQRAEKNSPKHRALSDFLQNHERNIQNFYSDKPRAVINRLLRHKNLAEKAGLKFPSLQPQ